MSFDATKPAVDTDMKTSNEELLANLVAIQKGEHITDASEPAGKQEGYIWYDSANNLLKAHNGSSWDTLWTPSSYDSGWFSVTTGTAYAKTHNLGTTKVLVSVFLGDQSDGSGKVMQVGGELTIDGASNQNFCSVRALTTTTITLRTGANRLANTVDAAGTQWQPTSGYARIIMLVIP